MTADIRGNALSCGAEAARRLDAASLKFHNYLADPIADLDALLAEHPDCVMAQALRAGILATTTDRTFAAEAAASLEEAERLAPRANAREQAHVAAVRQWMDGDLSGATERWGGIAIDHPRDLLAVQYGQLGDFFLGQSHMLRDRVARVLPSWRRDTPGYGFVLGMHAFGLEEAGDYTRAEAAGREAVAINPRDGWAAHAVAHVMEMQGRAAEGAAFMQSTAPGWAPDSLFAYHNWWHLALFYVEQSDIAAALRLFDERISAGGFGQALEGIDGSALLWRLWVLGHDVGDRWSKLLACWSPRRNHGVYAFNDVHAMMAFAATDDRAAQDDVIGTLKRAAARQGTNAMMSRDVGLPLASGIAAFGRGDYRAAVAHILPVRGIANRFGGSHAQRDIISWTLCEAAIRSGDTAMAEAMVAERLSAKERSPVAQGWAIRAKAMARPIAA
ncbi:tetratricopeptide repeat protein [Neoroseomonas lacus]|uniref:Tetratricopeptide repeat protein 38 n=1 Tax=Neoroseomonas lacus TaxID=287609 RepID=A0A917NZY7_9PROT|nr:tetratricopeptide repeat protein [Neoroseomonas lacus]GGJ45201.1 tetratricopeptide repeat protein 38 family protein [Neoroseomonas lacus]